jgi:hypothetical protein
LHEVFDGGMGDGRHGGAWELMNRWMFGLLYTAH